MMNIFLIVLEVITCYLALALLTKKYKTDGIYIYGIIVVIISCIMNLKKISIMNISIPLGFGVTTSILIGANLLVQKRGQEEIKKYLSIIIISFIAISVVFNIATLTTNSTYNILSNKSFNGIFLQDIRIYLAIIISLIFSTWLDSKLYYIIKKLQNKIIFSNIFSIIIVEFFENIIFVAIAYLFDYEIIDLFLCMIIRYMIKTLIGIIGTIPLYIVNKYN